MVFGGEQTKAQRAEFVTDYLRGEAARQPDGAGASGQGKLAEPLELGEIERQTRAAGRVDAGCGAAKQRAAPGKAARRCPAPGSPPCLSPADPLRPKPDRRETRFRRRRFQRSRTGPDAAAGCSRAPAQVAARRARDCAENADRDSRRHAETFARARAGTPRPAGGWWQATDG